MQLFSNCVFPLNRAGWTAKTAFFKNSGDLLAGKRGGGKIVLFDFKTALFFWGGLVGHKLNRAAAGLPTKSGGKVFRLFRGFPE